MDHQRALDKEMAELKDLILEMGMVVGGLIRKAVSALGNQDTKLAEKVVEEDEEVDRLELEIDEMTVQMIALRQPEASDLRFLMTASRISNDLERIGDLAEDVAENAIDLGQQPPVKPLVDLPKMGKLAEEAVALVLDAFVNRDLQKARAVWEKEKESDKLRDAIHDELLEIMRRNPDSVERAVPLLLISRHLERICDHATNIGEDVVYMVEGKVVKHGGGKE